MKTAIVTGATGQDGSYLMEQLLEDGYRVVPVIRRLSYRESTQRLMERPLVASNIANVNIEEGDITDAAFINKLVKVYRPDEYYNLAAMSYVKYSFDNPVSTMDINANSVAILIDALEKFSPATKIYQASTSEMFGGIHITGHEKQSEDTPFVPKSPYGVAKLAAHGLVRLARERGLFACCGILFNHESERRGSEFVTQKICEQLAEVKLRRRTKIDLGNMDASRDWGYAPEYTQGMRLMLAQEKPDDYVLATGTNHTIREFVQWVMDAFDLDGTPDDVTEIDPANFRPNEVQYLCGDPSKAANVMGWKAETKQYSLANVMAHAAFDRMM
jgi:GDPmannose 4,6-dehydratase